MEHILLGIDGGGTKTEGVLCHADGTVVSRQLTGPTNCNDLPAGAAAENLRRLAAALPAMPDVVFAGIAGAGNNRAVLLDMLSACFPGALIELASDAANILNAGLLDGDGCGLISGTGSVCFVRQSGSLRRIGGWGYLLDTRGSGYDIGRDGIYAALRAIDGRGGATLLTPLIESREGCPADGLLNRLYDGGKRYIASFAPLVQEAAQAGDAAALSILRENMAALGEMVQAASSSFEGEFPVALGGGILANSPLCRELLAASCPGCAKLLPPDLPPVFGAAFGAAKIAGNDDAEGFREAFREGYCNE